jgi:hypothetical protein
MGLNRLVYCNDFQTDSIASKYLHRNTPDFVVFCQLKFWHLIISSLENIFLAIWVTQGFFVPLQHVRAKEEKPFWVCQRSGC